MGRRKKTHEEFIEEVYELVGDEYIVLSEYIRSSKKVTLKHNYCECVFSLEANKFLRGRRCPECSTLKKTTEQFKKEVFVKLNDEYGVVEKYVNNITPIIVKHKLCNYEWKVYPSPFLRGEKKCPRCYESNNFNRKKTHEEFIEEVYELVGDEYIVTGKYDNVRTKLKIKHVTCGWEWDVNPHKFLQGSRCPDCRRSKGESELSDLIKSYGASYMPQKEFDGLMGLKGGSLRFDFEVNNKILIEYDGEFHFYKVYKNDGHENTVIHDKIKNQYCIDNNISLIRIPYTQQKSIEYILYNVLIHFGLIENKQDTYDKDIVLKYLVDKNWDHKKYIEENKAS